MIHGRTSLTAKPDRLEAVSIVAPDDRLRRLGVIGESELGAIPVEHLPGELGGLDGQQSGFGAS